jgi:hypothetical protein
MWRVMPDGARRTLADCWLLISTIALLVAWAVVIALPIWV